MASTAIAEPASSRTEAATHPKRTPLRPRPWLAVWSLTWREMARFFRQRNRVIGAVGQPLLFWLLFGAGLSRSFSLSPAGEGGQSFLAYYFPGSLMLILLFTAIFTTISIIEDRREGFLQAVLVAPIPRWSMVLGKVLGGSLIAMLQALVFLLLALTIQVSLSVGGFFALVALLFVTAVGLTSLGFIMAWRMESTQGFHAVMSLVLMPLWLLSGAFFPVPALTAESSGGQMAMHAIMRANPLTYGVAGARHLLYAQPLPEAFWTPSAASCWIVTVGFTVLAFAGACWISAQRTKGDLL